MDILHNSPSVATDAIEDWRVDSQVKATVLIFLLKFLSAALPAAGNSNAGDHVYTPSVEALVLLDVLRNPFLHKISAIYHFIDRIPLPGNLKNCTSAPNSVKSVG